MPNDSPTVSGSIQLKDDESGSYILDAWIYMTVSGDASSAQTWACGPTAGMGRADFTDIPNGNVNVRIVKRPDYNESRQVVLASGVNGMAVTKAKGLGQKISLKTTPGGCVITIAQTGANLETVTCDDSGVGVSSGSFMPGSYDCLAQRSTYTSTSTTISVVDGCTDYAVSGPVAPGSAAAPTSASPTGGTGNPADPNAPDTDPNVKALNPADAPMTDVSPSTDFDYEWIYPNSADGKYFTTTQARVYIGNLFIDELNSIQFALQGNRIPIYGYCSEDADAFGSGRRLVQGQILLNFISEGYLYTVLQEKMKLLKTATAAETKQQDDMNGLCEYRNQLQAALNDNTLTPSERTMLETELAQNEAAIAAAASQLGVAGVQAARRFVMNNANKLTSAKNAVYQKIAFDIVIELEGGGRTVTRTLKNCVLTSNEQIYDQSGVTLLDAYGFIARQLV